MDPVDAELVAETVIKHGFLHRTEVVRMVSWRGVLAACAFSGLCSRKSLAKLVDGRCFGR